MEIQVFGMLDACLTVTTSHDYFMRTDINFNPDKEPTDEQYAEQMAIQDILSMDVSIYLTRRTAGLCGSVIDNLRANRQMFISAYQKKYAKSYIDYNADIDF